MSDREAFHEHSACYICGSAEGRTRDHVFSRGLFTSPLPGDMLTAPACEDCQQRLQPDEEYFRTFAAAAGAPMNPTARELWEGRVPRSFDRSPGFRQTFADAISTNEWRTPAGIILGDVVGLEGDPDRIGNVLRKIVRGLSYLATSEVMPLDIRFNFSQVSPMTEPLPQPVMDIIHTTTLRTVGDVVRYKFAQPPDGVRFTISWFAFYERVMFAVWTWPEDVELPSTH